MTGGCTGALIIYHDPLSMPYIVVGKNGPSAAEYVEKVFP